MKRNLTNNQRYKNTLQMEDQKKKMIADFSGKTMKVK